MLASQFLKMLRSVLDCANFAICPRGVVFSETLPNLAVGPENSHSFADKLSSEAYVEKAFRNLDMMRIRTKWPPPA